MKFKKISLIELSLLIIIAISIYCYNKQQENIEQKNTEIIEELKEETGMTANQDLYEVQVEYDGKKILNIKSEIQYKIAFAGIIKNEVPKLEEIDEIFKREYPKNTGIWIETNSREQFLELINDNTNNEYEITEEGYLKIKNEEKPNEEDNALKSMINSERQFIVTISGTYYKADRVTGEILDNFFEEMDPYQTSKIVENKDNIIIFLTTNKEGKLTNREILQDITAYGSQNKT